MSRPWRGRCSTPSSLPWPVTSCCATIIASGWGRQPSAWRLSTPSWPGSCCGAGRTTPGINSVVVATALGFVAMVFPLQADAGLDRAGVGGGRGRALVVRAAHPLGSAARPWGRPCCILAVGRLLLVDTLGLDRTEPFVPVFNGYALPALGVAACMLWAALASRRLLPRPRDVDRVARIVAGLAGVLLVWLVLSLDTYQFFTTRPSSAAIPNTWSAWPRPACRCCGRSTRPCCWGRLQAEQQARCAGPGWGCSR